MSDSTPYKTLFTGLLVQRTAFSTGGNSPTAIVDAPLARDGCGRLTLRGTGLAGALIATARRLFPHLPAAITEGLPEGVKKRTDGDMEERLRESVWRFFTAHPVTATGAPYEPHAEYRSGVAILQKTGAAAEKMQFDTETTPVGTRWWFCLEVDDYRDVHWATGDGTVAVASAIAARALKEWQAGDCYLGRDVARGLGWMTLEHLRVHRLDARHVTCWPNARKQPQQALQALPTQCLLDGDAVKALAAAAGRTAEQFRLRGTGRVSVGAGDDDAYGLDSLSVGGSDLAGLQADLPNKNFERPVGQTQESWQEALSPDQVLAWTARMDGSGTMRHEPFIPGAGLRGSLRHTMSWWWRSRKGMAVVDPSASLCGATDEELPADDVANLFGTLDTDGALLVSDASLEGSQCKLMLLEHHAEDEFTASTYKSHKFNRMSLVEGEFSFEFTVEANSASELAAFKTQLALLDALGRRQFVPLGGANWRGHGWVRLALELDREEESPNE